MPDTISTGVGVLTVAAGSAGGSCTATRAAPGIDTAGEPAPSVDAYGGVVDVDGCTASEVEAFLAVVEPDADAAVLGCTGPISVVDPFL
jgi:hypothetical protein